MKGKNDSTPFLPLNSKTGGKVTYVQNKDDICLTERQADHVYKAVEKGNMINTKTVTCEMTQNHDDNPYKRVVLDLDTLDYRNHQDLYSQLKDEEIETLDIDFGYTQM